MEAVEFHHQLMERLRAVNSELTYLASLYYQPYGVTSVQAAVLMDLYAGGSRNMTELCHNLHMTNSNISAICKRLERADLVERRRDPEDERVAMVYLTDRAIRMIRRLMDEAEGKCRALFGMVPEEDKVMVLNGLDILCGWLCRIHGNLE